MNPFDPGYYCEEELRKFGIGKVGRNVQVATNCTIIGLGNIEIGDNVRIDGYTSIIAASGYLRLGSYIHIGSHCTLSAGEGIVMDDFSGLSQGVRIYSRTDDYTGKYLTNPTVPAKYTGATGGPVTLERHVIVGSGTIILPRLTVGEGSSIGAQSLVTKSLDPWGVYFGSPVKRLKNRSKALLELEAVLLADRPPA